MEPNKNKEIIIGVVIVAAVAALAWWGIGSWGGTNDIPQANKSSSGTNGVSGDQNLNIPLAEGKFDIKISAGGFDPSIFRVKKSQQLDINVINEEKNLPNTFKFEKLPFNAIAPADGNRSFTIVAPDKPGEYIFFTDVGQIRKGTMKVE